MKKTLFIVLALFVLTSVLLAACGGGQAAAPSESDEPKVEVPAAYAGKTNPLAGNADAAAKGKEIFNANCASCHGEGGKGDGPAGASLDPKPGVLAGDTKGDDYLYYRIADGGMMDPFNSSMPAWKDILKEEEIWQVVTHIRSLQ